MDQGVGEHASASATNISPDSVLDWMFVSDLKLLRSGLDSAQAAISGQFNRLTDRADQGMVRCAAAAIDTFHMFDTFKRGARATLSTRWRGASKAIDEAVEVLDVGAKQLDCAASIVERDIPFSVDAPDALSAPPCTFSALSPISLMLVMGGLSQHREGASFSKVLSCSIDINTCEVFGPGTGAFTVSEPGTHNRITVLVRDTAGDMAEWVTESDVIVTCDGVRQSSVAVTLGEIHAIYTVTQPSLPVGDVRVVITVAGEAVFDRYIPPLRVKGAVTSSFNIRSCTSAIHSAGLAVSHATPPGRIALSYHHTLDCVDVCRADTLECLFTLGGKGKGPGQFDRPGKMCFVDPSDNLLVCDVGNERLQEFSATGAHIRSIHVPHVSCVAVRGDVLVCGRGTGYYNPVRVGEHVFVFSYATGERVRVFGQEGSGPGRITFTAHDVCISPGGMHLLVADAIRVSVFSMSSADASVDTHAISTSTALSGLSVAYAHGDPRFVRFIGERHLSRGDKCVACTPNGDVIVVDSMKPHVLVYALDTGVLTQKFEIPAEGVQPTIKHVSRRVARCMAFCSPRLYLVSGTYVRGFHGYVLE